ncbi:MAG: amino acid decarboxylase [Oscillospiraceae bacterium]|nr:amino acid decarboxylase [Oscillospiraceae bacterium]
MNTPIVDFVRQYRDSGAVRLHMPGHKGLGPLGVESLDITEINGADSLYEASGIIRESEENASSLFGCPTFYSTEGSSQCIRAMLYLVTMYARQKGIQRPLIAAGRNVHKTFLSAAALLDIEVDWLYPNDGEAYLCCDINADKLERYFSECETLPVAVYITSPDYLGNVLYVDQLVAICHHHGVLLVVDNAHGAYLKFLPNSRHPIDLGADLCCDSAHKTLPVLTGGAYLHVSSFAPVCLREQAKNALALFGSTSPSYLILQSLDAANQLLADSEYISGLAALSRRVSGCRQALTSHGLNADLGNEPLKLTIYPRNYGYSGIELAECLRENGIECEFSDPDFVVLMFTPAIPEADIQRLMDVLMALPRRAAVRSVPPMIHRPARVLSIREAALSPGISLPVEECVGRVLQAATVGCPPAVPIVVCGERIDKDALEVFRYYGITHCNVI